MTRQIIFKHFYDQCVQSVQGSLLYPSAKSSVYIFLLHTVGQHWRQQAKCKSFIKHYLQIAALSRSHMLSLIYSLPLSFCTMRHSLFARFWQLWRQCLISRAIACTHTLTHTHTKHASRMKQRAAAGERKSWLDILSGSQRREPPTQLPRMFVCVCVCVCACVWNGRRSIAFRWQFINFISSSLHLFLAHTHTLILRLWKLLSLLFISFAPELWPTCSPSSV